MSIRRRLKPEEESWRERLRDSTVVGVIGDTHEPFCLDGYREHCYDVFSAFHVNRVIHIGDLVDAYAFSRYDKDPEAMSAGLEADEAIDKLKPWYEMFPEVTVTLGNHDLRIAQRIAGANIPKRFVKSFHEAFEMPEGWTTTESVEIDNVLYTHGTGTGGKDAAYNRALSERQSLVMGHIHSFGGVKYSQSNKDRIFGLNVGCGIDINTYAAAYAKDYPKKPTIGCGVVIGGEIGLFIPMT